MFPRLSVKLWNYESLDECKSKPQENWTILSFVATGTFLRLISYRFIRLIRASQALKHIIWREKFHEEVQWECKFKEKNFLYFLMDDGNFQIGEVFRFH